MQPIREIHSRTAVLPYTNIDTDQILPARFLRTTIRDGLGAQLFADWRRRTDGSDDPAFPLNHPDSKGCTILVAGRNFGCGSSREHAPWALLDAGFRAIISTEIADIFCSNSLKNGLLPIVVDESTGEWLIAHPGADVRIDLSERLLSLPTGVTVDVPIEAFSRYCLLNGIDETGYLLSKDREIRTYEKGRGW